MDNNNSERVKLDSDLRVLEERVAKNEEILNIWLRSYRNYAIIIGALLTLFGITSVFYVIKTVVKSTTETKLEEILTDEYVEEKIGKKGEKAIKKLASKFEKEIEKKAREVFDELSSYGDMKEKAFIQFRCKNYGEAIKCYKKALEKIHIMSSLFSQGRYAYEKNTLHLGLAEAQILEKDYRGALENGQHALSSASTKGDKILCNFHICIAKKLLDEDISQAEEQFNKSLGKGCNINWRFDSIKEWLAKSDISDDEKAYIRKKMELVDQCRDGIGSPMRK